MFQLEDKRTSSRLNDSWITKWSIITGIAHLQTVIMQTANCTNIITIKRCYYVKNAPKIELHHNISYLT